MKTLNHEIPDRIPVLPQDSHVAAYLGGVDFMDWAYDPVKRAKASIEQRERFDFDGSILCGETTILAEAAGGTKKEAQQAAARLALQNLK